MERCRIGKIIAVCFLLCCFLGYITINDRMIVKAEEHTVLTNNDMELQSTEKENEKSILINWKEVKDVLISILIEMLGAFLGFLSAIVLTHRSDRKHVKELDCSLLGELKILHGELEERFKDETNMDYYRYQTPIWDINLESGTLALVINSKIYNKYIQIYSKIQYAQELESEYVHTKVFRCVNKEDGFTTGYIMTLDEARKREAHAIYEYIEKKILGECENARRNNEANVRWWQRKK